MSLFAWVRRREIVGVSSMASRAPESGTYVARHHQHVSRHLHALKRRHAGRRRRKPGRQPLRRGECRRPELGGRVKEPTLATEGQDVERACAADIVCGVTCQPPGRSERAKQTRQGRSFAPRTHVRVQRSARVRWSDVELQRHRLAWQGRNHVLRQRRELSQRWRIEIRTCGLQKAAVGGAGSDPQVLTVRCDETAGSLVVWSPFDAVVSSAFDLFV